MVGDEHARGGFCVVPGGAGVARTCATWPLDERGAQLHRGVAGKWDTVGAVRLFEGLPTDRRRARLRWFQSLAGAASQHAALLRRRVAGGSAAG